MSCISGSVPEEDEDYEEDKENEEVKLRYYAPPMNQRPYEKLIAWQEAFQLCLWTYQVTSTFPADERFSLTSQMRRSAQSVPMNIAEGNAKRSAKEKTHFFEMALSSLEELHCQFRIALGLAYIQQRQFAEADDRIHRISYLINKLRSAIL